MAFFFMQVSKYKSYNLLLKKGPISNRTHLTNEVTIVLSKSRFRMVAVAWKSHSNQGQRFRD
jgi:hypothetical protein